jgi:hypothetical protein
MQFALRTTARGLRPGTLPSLDDTVSGRREARRAALTTLARRDHAGLVGEDHRLHSEVDITLLP